MTVITIKPKCIEISGHAAEPVVCHGLSAISNMVANYIADHGWGRVTYGDGYLKITGMQPERYNDPLLEAFKRAIIDIANEYPGNIIIKSNLDTFSQVFILCPKRDGFKSSGKYRKGFENDEKQNELNNV